MFIHIIMSISIYGGTMQCAQLTHKFSVCYKVLCFHLEWERWNIACKQFNLLLRTDENTTSPEAEAYLKKNQGMCM